MTETNRNVLTLLVAALQGDKLAPQALRDVLEEASHPKEGAALLRLLRTKEIVQREWRKAVIERAEWEAGHLRVLDDGEIYDYAEDGSRVTGEEQAILDGRVEACESLVKHLGGSTAGFLVILVEDHEVGEDVVVFAESAAKAVKAVRRVLKGLTVPTEDEDALVALTRQAGGDLEAWIAGLGWEEDFRCDGHRLLRVRRMSRP